MAPLVVLDDQGFSGPWPDYLLALSERTGCSFVLSSVPKARINMELASADPPDLVLPVTRSHEQDTFATFIPLQRQRLVLLTLKENAGSALSVASLLAQKQWHGVTARGYSFGSQHGELMQQLSAQRRLYQVNSVEAILRMLRAGRAEFAVLPMNVALLAAQDSDFRVGEVRGLGSFEIGAYLVQRSLNAQDRAVLKHALESSIVPSGPGLLARGSRRYSSSESARAEVVPTPVTR